MEINLKQISKLPPSARLRATGGAPVNLLNVRVVCLSVEGPLFSKQLHNQAGREVHLLGYVFVHDTCLLFCLGRCPSSCSAEGVPGGTG